MSSSAQDPGGPASLGDAIRIGVVFDLDGTLIDSRFDIAAAANHALATLGFRTLSVSEIASYVGDGARPLLARAAQLGPEATELEPLLAAFLSYYAAHPTDHTLLSLGASEALAELHHLPLALCTNKPRSITDAVLSNLRLAAAFTVVVGGGDLPRAKPDPLPLQHIAEKLGLNPGQQCRGRRRHAVASTTARRGARRRAANTRRTSGAYQPLAGPALAETIRAPLDVSEVC